MGAGRALVSSTAGAERVTLLIREKGVTKAMNNHTNKRKKRPPRRSPKQANSVRFPLPFVMLLCWMRSYAGDEECSCGASPNYEIDSFVNAEALLEAEGSGEKDQVLLSSLEQQRNGAFEVHQTFLVCRQHALKALSPLRLGIGNLTVTVGREITNAKSPHGTLQVSYTNATTVPEVIEAHTGYAVTKIPKRPSTITKSGPFISHGHIHCIVR
jgi:hypothetical protein